MSESADLIAGRYRLADQIGIGGMGVVWRARDELLGRTVALKELAVPAGISVGRADEDARRAMREARIAARLHHPNVIGIYDVVDHDGRPFLVMEYLASRSLSQLMAEGELLSPVRAGRIGAELATALAAAHDAGIVHRDVKPGNVLIGNDGSVKLTDFGISRAVGDATVTASGIVLGTLGYIAPETAQGEHADARADVYALGATLYAAVEGHAPFGENDNAVALMYRIVHEPIIPMQHAGPLEPVLLWMLQRDPALRPTMRQAQRALEAIASERSPAESETLPVAAAGIAAAATPPPPTAIAAVDGNDSGNGAAPGQWRPRQPRNRRALLAVLIVAALLALGGWMIAALLDHGSGSSSAASKTTHTPTARAASPTAPASSASPSSHPVTATKSAAAATSTPPAPAPKPSASAAPSTAHSQDVAAQLVSTIVNYYKLMPNNLEQGWGWMTADYQQNHAGGWNGYQAYWRPIQRVSVSNVTASPPSTVTATIDYYYKNGSTVEELTQFGMVFQDGRWKIASSSVLSSQSR